MNLVTVAQRPEIAENDMHGDSPNFVGVKLLVGTAVVYLLPTGNVLISFLMNMQTKSFSHIYQDKVVLHELM